MQKIRSINLSKLRKLDLPDLAESTIKVIEDFDPEVLKIKEAYDLLVAKQPAIDILKKEYGPHVITPELRRLRRERKAYIAVIATQARSLSSLEMEGSENGVKAAGMHCEFYLKNYDRLSERNKYLRLSEFFREIEENEELETACSEMGLTSHLNDLRSVHSRLKVKWETRDSSIAARPKVNIPPIARSLRNAMSNMFSQINNAQSENLELDYSLLISELNRKIAHYTSLINTRMTTAEKKKAMEEAEAEGESGTSGEVQVTSARNGVSDLIVPTEKTTRLSVVDDKVDQKNENDVSETQRLNIEKAAAKSSKNEQLPSVDNEDLSITS